MKVSNLLAILRGRLDDAINGNSILGWSDFELIDDYAEEARKDLFRFCNGDLLIDSATAADPDGLPMASISLLAASGGLYQMSPYVLGTRRLQLASQTYPLTLSTLDDLDRWNPDWRNLAAGTVITYCLEYQSGSILFVPAPSANDTAALTNSIYPTTPLSSLTPGMDLGFNVLYHNALVPGILAKAFAKEDVEISRPDLAESYEAKFRKKCDEISVELSQKQTGPRHNRPNRAFTSK